MKEFTIDRSRWLRGDPEKSSLLDKDGGQCCLGFYLSACGVSDEILRGRSYPKAVYNRMLDEMPDPAMWLIDLDERTGESRECAALIKENDHGYSTAQERRIAKMFAAHGVTVHFVDFIEQPRTNAARSKP